MPKLLLDNNLSPRLLKRIEDLFPGSAHVMELELDRESDWSVWNYARSKNFTLVSKDSDFNDLTLLRGAPPKIIWIRTGNCRVTEIEAILRRHAPFLVDFIENSDESILELRS